MKINAITTTANNYETLKSQRQKTAFAKSEQTGISFKGYNKNNNPVWATGVNISFKGLSEKPQKGTYEWALSWDENARKNELQDELKNAKKAMSFWKKNFTSAVKKLQEANDEMLSRERIMVTTLLQNATRLQGQIDDLSAITAENAKTSAQIEQDKIKLRKWQIASDIASAFKIDTTGGLDSRIAGYEAEKQIMRNAYVEEVAMEKAGMNANVPNSILLYGAIGTGKTTFSQAVAHETGAKLIEINPSPENFAKDVTNELKAARERYSKTGKRTIILLNEIDIHLEDTKTNRQNIAMMKNWLDNCGKLPTDDMQNSYATTFFFTTNHPLDITDEIIEREEKLGKVVALEPAAEDNIKKIIQFYIDKYDKDGTILFNEHINYDEIIKKLNPDDEKGAFGNDKIKKIVELAFGDFNRDIENNKTFEQYLNERIDKAKRNIKPEKLQDYKEQLEYLCED